MLPDTVFLIFIIHPISLVSHLHNVHYHKNQFLSICTMCIMPKNDFWPFAQCVLFQKMIFGYLHNVHYAKK